ncbi:hypothetical protein HDU89_002643 [Geranomyces variabilis]|nr:hypothetical protein HDU89_002643 [Geranomyces variabilis]
MDHSGHSPNESAGMGHGSMAMVWNWSYDSTVVFTFWTSDGPGSLVLSCLAIFALSFFFEGFRSFRSAQDRRLLSLVEKPSTNDRYGKFSEEDLDTRDGNVVESQNLLGARDSSVTIELPCEDAGQAVLVDGQDDGPPTRALASRGVRPYQAYRAILHGAELFYGYFLMMAFMTLNGFLCISLVLGATHSTTEICVQAAVQTLEMASVSYFVHHVATY